MRFGDTGISPVSLLLPWRSRPVSSSAACFPGVGGYLETPISHTREATSQPPSQPSRVKDTFLAIIIGQAGQDSGQDPGRVGQHHPAGQLDELTHPAHGCQLDQVIWKRNGGRSGRVGTSARVLPPTDQARRGLRACIDSSLTDTLSPSKGTHTGSRLGWESNLVTHVREATALYPSAPIKRLGSSSQPGVSSFPLA